MAHQKVKGNAESITLLLYTIASILQPTQDGSIPVCNSSLICHVLLIHVEASHRQEQAVTQVAHQHHHPAPNSAPARKGEIWRSCWFNLTQSTSPYMNHWANPQAMAHTAAQPACSSLAELVDLATTSQPSHGGLPQAQAPRCVNNLATARRLSVFPGSMSDRSIASRKKIVYQFVDAWPQRRASGSRSCSTYLLRWCGAPCWAYPVLNLSMSWAQGCAPHCRTLQAPQRPFTQCCARTAPLRSRRLACRASASAATDSSFSRLEAAALALRQAPPSEKYEFSKDVLDAMVALKQEGALRLWGSASEEPLQARPLQLWELKRVGIKEPAAIGVASIRAPASSAAAFF